ncbi:Jag family protein [Flindersiella endophytica]
MSDVREETASVADEESRPELDAEVDANDGADEPSTESDTDSDQGEAESALTGADLIAHLEHEGDIAADYLEELLDIADLDGDIDLDVEGDRAAVAVVGGGLSHLAGSDGSVLEALQELTRLAVYRETGRRSRLMLDIAGFRAGRRRDLTTLAEQVVEEVRSTGESVRLDPMTPFERKIVHDTVAAKGLISESEGEEPERRVVVRPA